MIKQGCIPIAKKLADIKAFSPFHNIFSKQLKMFLSEQCYY